MNVRADTAPPQRASPPVTVSGGHVSSRALEVAVIGAFDRFNYGDVLFALVARNLFDTHLPGSKIAFYGLRRSDQTALGGTLTRPLADLYRAPPAPSTDRVFFFSGGELLAPNWAHMANHLVPPSIARNVLRITLRVGYERASRFWRRVYRCPNRVPWTIDPRDLPQARSNSVVYNSLGGTTLKGLSQAERAWQTEALSRSQWLSVRDEPTADTVEARGLPRPAVTPDSAVVMRMLISDEDVRARSIRILSAAGLPDAPYLVFQSGERYARPRIDSIAASLTAIHQRTGLNVLGLSIGTAPGHEDQITARRVAERLGNAPWFKPSPPDLDVLDIMSAIGGSRGYMGTSLHGFITAFVFGAPRVGLHPAVQKLTGFRDAWDAPEMPTGIDFDDMPDALDRASAANAPGAAEATAEAYMATFREIVRRIKERAA